MPWKTIHCSLSRVSKKEQNRWNSDDWRRRDDWVFILRLIDNIIVILRARRIWVAAVKSAMTRAPVVVDAAAAGATWSTTSHVGSLTRIVYLSINNNTIYYILNYYYYFVRPRRRWPPAPPRILGTRPSGEPCPVMGGGGVTTLNSITHTHTHTKSHARTL